VYTDDKATHRKGRIALHVSSPDAGGVVFKKIAIKELPPEEPGWVQLFNGKDLTGWKTHPERPGGWTVEDGVLVGRAGPGGKYLFDARGGHRDFHFRVEAKLNAEGDAGQVFRCQYGFGAEVAGGMVPRGYEANISQVGVFKTGTLSGADWPPEGGKGVEIPADTWFTQEVIARDNHIVVKVNGKVIVNYNDRRHSYRQGHLALQAWVPGTVVRFRKIEIKELPPADVAPFVVLGKAGRPETQHATLVAAVKAAGSGDTIEIRGDGPFLSEVIDLGEKTMTIRAAAGFRPVIKAEGQPGTNLLLTKASLVLEGLELVRDGENEKGFYGVVRASGSSLRIAGCRIRMLAKGGGHPVQVGPEVRDCDIRNSLLQCGGPWEALHASGPTRLKVENCVLTAWNIPLILECAHFPDRDSSVTLRGNTLLAKGCIAVRVYGPPPQPPNGAHRGKAPFTTAGNLFVGKGSDGKGKDSAFLALNIFADRDKVPLAVGVKFLREGFAWKGDKDLFALNISTIWLAWRDGIDGSEYVAMKDLPELGNYIGGSTVSGPDAFRCAGGLLRTPADMHAADFRLAPGSPGKGAGPGGKDLGADVDLVGPGEAYEKWKKTKDYATWCKEVDAFMNVSPPAEQKTPVKVEAHLKGDWIQVANQSIGLIAELFGQVPEPDKMRVMSCTASKITLRLDEESYVLGPYRIDPKQSPKTVDITITLRDGKQATLQGIYELEGSRLMLCLDSFGGARPAGFPKKAKDGDDKGLGRIALLTFRRIGADPRRDALDRNKVKGAANLATIARIMHDHVLDKRVYPAAAIYSKDGKPLLSWRVALLGRMDQGKLLKQFKIDEPWDSAHNKKLIDKMPSIYALPGVETKQPGLTFFRVCTGKGTIFEGKEGLKFEDHLKGDGPSFMIVEAAEPVTWTKPEELAYDPAKPLPRLGRLTSEGFHAAMTALGERIEFIPAATPEEKLRSLIQWRRSGKKDQ